MDGAEEEEEEVRTIATAMKTEEVEEEEEDATIITTMIEQEEGETGLGPDRDLAIEEDIDEGGETSRTALEEDTTTIEQTSEEAVVNAEQICRLRHRLLW